MAIIVKGSTFSSTVTAGGMHALVESATISGIDRTSLDSTTITVATQQAALLDGANDRELWQALTGNGLGSWLATASAWYPALPQIVRYRGLVNAITAGQALCLFGTFDSDINDLTFAPATPPSSAKVVAVALADCAVGDHSLAVAEGPAYVQCTGTVNAGEAVRLSNTAGKVQSAGAVGSGGGWENCGTALGADSGGFVWISLRR